MDEKVSKMSIKQLKECIVAAGLSHADCSEKSELQARAASALGRSAAYAAHEAKTKSSGSGSKSSSGFTTTTETLGGYSCTVRVRGGSGPVDAVVLIYHGLGATNSDFASIPEILDQSSGTLREKRIAYIFPQAPMLGQQTAWWHLNVMEWAGALYGGDAALGELIRKEHRGVAECRAQGLRLITDTQTRFQGARKLILGGFSQGAMTSTDLALRLPASANVAAILHLSGAPIDVNDWARNLRENQHLKQIRVLQTHGRSDQMLPFMVSGWTKSLLEQAGLRVDWHPHSGAHELGDIAIVARFLGDVVGS